MAVMLLTEMTPPQGADSVALLRARAGAARRAACACLMAVLALLPAAGLLADRAGTAQQALPPAVLSLAVFLGGLPALAVTQAVWGARAELLRRRERELYGVARSARLWPLTRPAVALGWAVTLLLGCTVPGLFRAAGRDALAGTLSWVIETTATALAAAGAVAGVWLLFSWAREAAGMRTRAGRPGGSPGDPWDPGPGARPHGTAALWACAAAADVGLVAARAHLWEPSTGLVCALLAAALACAVVTDE